MASADIFFLVGAFSLFAIAVALVPVLIQLKRTLRKTESLVDSLNNHVDPLCKSLDETSSEMQIFFLGMNDKIEQTDVILHNIKKSTDTLVMASTLAKDALKPFITGFGGISAGVKAFSYFLAKTGNKR